MQYNILTSAKLLSTTTKMKSRAEKPIATKKFMVKSSSESRIQQMAELILFSPPLPGRVVNLPARTQLRKR